MVYDMVIVGAGPAGTTLARMLDKRYKVLLIDKRNLSESSAFKFNKCCGGLLAPDAQKVLAQFGLGVPKDVLVGPQVFTVRSVDLDNKIQKYYQRHYINVDREKFDRWLFSLVPSHVSIKTNCHLKNFKQDEGIYHILVSSQGGEEIIKAKHLIGADGATSKIRRVAFKDKPQPQLYLSIQEWFETERHLPHYVSVFDKNITDFYSWVIQKDDYIIVGSAIKDHHRANEKFHQLILKLKDKGYVIGNRFKREGTWIMRTRKIKQVNLYHNKVSLIGEAAGFISPSSAEGISYALRSGAFLAEAMNTSIEDYGVIYKRKARHLKSNLLIKNFKVIVMYQKFLRKMIMKSGILSMEVDKS